MIFLTAGVVLHDRKGRVNLTPAFCVYGVFSLSLIHIWTDDKVAQGFGVGRMTVQRFIRLTELIPPILQMVDAVSYTHLDVYKRQESA